MPAASALAPLAWLYGAAAGARGWLYDAGWLRARALPVPVISVGNLTVGGSGKSPMTAHVARLLHERGLRPAVVSRGYRGSHTGAATTVSAGSGPLVDAAVAGDEPVMLARMLPGVPVIVSHRRVDGGARAVEEHGARCVVLDDGFQHRALRRDLDILMMDTQDALEGARLLPAGRLREPVSAMRRAGAIVMMGRGPAAAGILAAAEIHCPRAPILRATAKPAGLIDAASGRSLPLAGLAGMRVACFAGIAHPDRFFADVGASGARIVARLPYRDHHAYTRADLDRIRAEASRAGAALLLTTMKDLARLGSGALPDLHALAQDLEVEEPDRLAALLVEAAS